MSSEYFIGLISGTSMDGIDAALARFSGDGFKLLAALTQPWPKELRQQLQTLANPGDNEIDRLGEVDILVGEQLATAALKLLDKAGIPATEITAIGSHGQTIRHRPAAAHPFTLQIGDPNHIAQRTGITTIADFRRRDMAAGGEGAPLVPAFHVSVFQRSDETRLVLNIGGIANLTLLPSDTALPVTGFDTGPGNCLLDAWIRTQRGEPFDRSGQFAASGKVQEALLAHLLADDYFRQPAPKSTGPEHFSLAWLNTRLDRFPGLAPEDIQATLMALTIESITQAVMDCTLNANRLLVCGGGVHNKVLIQGLAQRLEEISVESTADHGLDPDYVEAAAFAWLARQTWHRLPGNLPTVTGAKHPVILGGIYTA